MKRGMTQCIPMTGIHLTAIACIGAVASPGLAVSALA